jgi:uncharacterized protein
MFRPVKFERDPAKGQATEQQRGVRFERATEIFAGRLIEWTDERKDYGERRLRAVGESSRVLLHVVFTRRAAVIRHISARRANKKEQAIWLSRA